MDIFAMNSPLNTLELGLDALSMRHNSVNSNIANVSVPNYKRQFVTFEETLQQVQSANKLSDIPLQKTHPKHMDNDIFKITDIKPEKHIDTASEIHSNGNNVDIDIEMINLAKTGLKFKAVADLTKREFQGMRRIINGSQ